MLTIKDEITANNYHFIERVLNRFKNKEIGYSEAIHCITERYEQDCDRYAQAMLEEALKLMPEKIKEGILPGRKNPAGGVMKGGMWYVLNDKDIGWNSYHDKFLSSLKNGGFIKE